MTGLTNASARAQAWGRIPEELRGLRQWCLSRADKIPLHVVNGGLRNASVTDPRTWMSFHEAAVFAWQNAHVVSHHTTRYGKQVTQHGYNVGLVLTQADPYSCIDLDVKDAEEAPDNPDLWTTPEQYDVYYRIMQHFNSYTEVSSSGKGLHILVRGNIGAGARREGIEVYSQERYIITTGNVVHAVPIAERQVLLANMTSQMHAARKDTAVGAELEELPELEDDWSVLTRAINAGNADKFEALWRGQWQALGFPSQSEADLALLSMLTFYSPSNAQCRRIFRDCALGKREKAQKNDAYLNRTLRIIRGREKREANVDVSAIGLAADTLLRERALAAQEVERMQGMAPAAAPHAPRSVAPLHVQGQGTPLQAAAPMATVATLAAPVAAPVALAGAHGVPWPPGLAGRIAQFIYQSSPRPVKEVSIVSALGLLAGLCGKAWHIPGSGLNLYIILVARSAVGKEAMHSGISMIIKACIMKCPTFHNFVDFTEYSSGPALIKACAGNPCFVNVSGEWGRRLKRLANDDRDSALSTLRTQMTNLYQKSGPQSVVGGIGYSNKDNNVASVSGVAYSLIGETTPKTFYESLNEGVMEDGFLSRFLIVEYAGLRPEANRDQMQTPDAALLDALCNIAMTATQSVAANRSMAVQRTEEAAKVFDDFERECDNAVNGTDDEAYRQMWNRAALKVLRVAALLAVADNHLNPVIEVHQAEWALALVRQDIRVMGQRMENGDVGQDDGARERKIIGVMRKYLRGQLTGGDIAKVPQYMRDEGIIPRSVIQRRTNSMTAFANHRLGATPALNLALTTCVDNGYIMEVDKAKMAEICNFHGKCYRILQLPEYGADA